MGKIEDLEKLQQLKESGILTDEEFENEKKMILNETSQNTSNKRVKPRMKLKEKRKQILCIIGIISLFLVGLYGATRNQINELITQHRLNSSTSSSKNNSANQKESQNKSKKQKIQLTYNDLMRAILNTQDLELNSRWEYIQIDSVIYYNRPKQVRIISSREENKYFNRNKNIYHSDIKLSKMTTSNENVLSNNVSNLAFRKSQTGGKYDVIVGTVDEGIPTLYSHKHKNYNTDEIIAFVPNFNMVWNDAGIVTSVSFCSSISNNNEHISYKTFPYEKFLPIKEAIVRAEKRYIEQTGLIRYGDNIDYAIDGWYSPQYYRSLDIKEIMRELNYKSSEYDIEKDFTEETKNTDIEFYSVQEDGSLKLEYTSTGTIITMKIV